MTVVTGTQLYLKFNKEHSEKIVNICYYKQSEIDRKLTNFAQHIAQEILHPENANSLLNNFDVGLSLGKLNNLLSDIKKKVQHSTDSGNAVLFEPEEFKALMGLITERMNLKNEFINKYSLIYSEYLCDPNYKSESATQKQALNCIETSEFEYEEMLQIKMEITKQIRNNTF